MTLQQNTDRIQTTHIGSLPRPHDVLDLLRAKFAGQPYDEHVLDSTIANAVKESVRRQVESGIDIEAFKALLDVCEESGFREFAVGHVANLRLFAVPELSLEYPVSTRSLDPTGYVAVVGHGAPMQLIGGPPCR
jgi:hypothetical protein